MESQEKNLSHEVRKAEIDVHYSWRVAQYSCCLQLALVPVLALELALEQPELASPVMATNERSLEPSNWTASAAEKYQPDCGSAEPNVLAALHYQEV